MTVVNMIATVLVCRRSFTLQNVLFYILGATSLGSCFILAIIIEGYMKVRSHTPNHARMYARTHT